MEWIEPWHPITELNRQVGETLEKEVIQEVEQGHSLFGIQVKAIAQNQACDDVLFQLLDGTGRVAVVHLTWSRSKPDRHPWPITVFFSDLSHWVESRHVEQNEFTA